jgi:hypothetical protein
MKRAKLLFPIAFGADDRIDGYFVSISNIWDARALELFFFTFGQFPGAKMVGYFTYDRHPQGRSIDSQQIEAEPGFVLEMFLKGASQMIVEFNKSLIFQFSPGLGQTAFEHLPFWDLPVV